MSMRGHTGDSGGGGFVEELKISSRWLLRKIRRDVKIIEMTVTNRSIL